MRTLIAGVCLLFSVDVAFSQYDSLFLKNRTYHVQRGLHALYRTTKADVVMLGNSITFGANWSELLGRPGVVNRGIGGDNTYGFLNRMDDVTTLHPKCCFIMGGINDIFSDIPLDTIYVNYIKIVNRLREHDIIPIIQSTLHVSPKWKRASEKNPIVTQLNQLLREYAREKEIEYIDVDAKLSENESLKDENTIDGVHLTAEAYRQWVELVDSVLRKNGW